MNINEIINSIIQEYLNEYNYENSFLSNYDTAIKYAYENIDDIRIAFDYYDKNPNDIHFSFRRDKYIELIELYVDKYNELKNSDNVTIYRLVMLESINDLDVNNIGMHWSFEKNGC